MAVWMQKLRDSNVKYYTVHVYEAMEREAMERVQAVEKAQDVIGKMSAPPRLRSFVCSCVSVTPWWRNSVP